MQLYASRSSVNKAMRDYNRGIRIDGARGAKTWFLESPDGQLLPLKHIIGIASGINPRDFTTSQAKATAKSIGLTPIEKSIGLTPVFTGHQILRDIVRVNAEPDVDSTAKEQLILARLGQGKFRRMLCRERASCYVTGYSDLTLLVASHIRPWKLSNNDQRLDPKNGILLIPQLDRAFDLGLISFEDDGSILLSSALANPAALGIKPNMKLAGCLGREKYLKYHRERVFK